MHASRFIPEGGPDEERRPHTATFSFVIGRKRQYDLGMTGQDVKEMPIHQKLQIMEAIWEDFRDRFDRMDLSQQQKDLLDQRRARVRQGVAQLLDWEAVKGTIGRP